MTEQFRQNVTQGAALASLLTAFFILPPANAAQSDPVRAEGVDIRLVASAPQVDGKIPAMLDIRLAPGWKTYWIDPGSSGLPPQVTVSGPGLRFDGVRFPAPKAFEEGSARSVGYADGVALPLALSHEAGAMPARVTAQVMIGVCKDICVPVQASLSADLSGPAAANPLDKARIALAEESLPGPPQPDLTVTSARVKDTKLVLEVTAPAGEAPQIFLSSSNGASFGTPAIVSAGPGRFRAETTLRLPKAKAPADAGITAVLVSGRRAVEMPLVFE
ncbi:hypothetical protein BTR14_21235 [Rhizobium rhizosphaerae]|uniref:Thiol:disulfide interchange protein DsbD N-terminal domain-containing protein n=2 Tax=Xaviernesmea rhizosphaerae TaxID=1672749 RepID=A0ABX3P7K7_9HYPH|nr:hypothetical protein BTR14_21235 [Xaviernesmea rhizosphaerae]